MTRLLALVSVLALTACQQRSDQTGQPAGGGSAAAASAGQAPDSFRVDVETGKGRVVLQVVRAWSPIGADRFYQLVQSGYYDGVKFFRVLPGFIVQFGMNGDPGLNQKWSDQPIQDEAVKESNRRGTLTFAKGGPNSRTTQMFINTGDNPPLDGMGFPPIGRVVEGMDVVDKLYSGYGEGAPQGRGPSQDQIRSDGNRYLNRYFPQLDSIITARVVAR